MGRTRAFDVDDALEQAMLVFWQLGYERATLTDLTDAMGINRPSLYATFGDKDQLFRKALELYGRGPNGYAQQALDLPTAREVAEALLHGAAALQTRPDLPRGCLAILGALSVGDDPSPIGCALIQDRTAGETALRQRLERAHAEGDLPADADPAELAGYVRTIAYGMAVKATTGATREELDRVIEIAMRAWPAG